MDNNPANKKPMSFREQLEQSPAAVEFRETLARQRKEVEAIRAEYDVKKAQDV